MKKLLALILCVMMFVSVIPTAAFAADIGFPPAAVTKKFIKDMIENVRDEIELAYQNLSMDKTVYSSAKGMDDILADLVDAITKDMIGEKMPGGNKFTKEAADAMKAELRSAFDAILAKKLSDNEYKYIDGEDFLPLEFAKVFTDAVNSALTDKDFQKVVELTATEFAIVKLVNDVNDELEDKYEEFYNEVADSSFDEKFAARYPQLAQEYINTLTEAIADPTLFEDVWPWVSEYYPSWSEIFPAS